MSTVNAKNFSVNPNKIRIFGLNYTKEQDQWIVPIPTFGNILVSVRPGTGSLEDIIEVLEEDISLGKDHLIDHIKIDHHKIALAYLEGLISAERLQNGVDKGEYFEFLLEINGKEYKTQVYPADKIEGCATYTAEGTIV